MLLRSFYAMAENMTDEANIKKDISQRTTSGLNMLAREAMPLLRRLLGKKGMMTADILVLWRQIAGEDLAAGTMPEKICFAKGKKQEGVLCVAAAGGAYAMELQYREKQILDKINIYLGHKGICRLKIRQNGKMPDTEPAKKHQPPAKKTLVSEEEQNYINQLTGGITDKNLQNILSRLGESVFSQNANKQEHP